MKEIVIATTNQGKLKEIKKIFADLPFKFHSLSDFPGFPEIIEDGNTFEENAEIKARAVFDKTGEIAIGDDSGLVVEQLNGRPGIYSARYSGPGATYESNNIKLLQELENFPEPHFAKFVCAAVYFDGKEKIVKRGEVKGKIIKEPRGTNGFGYDPVFIPEGFKLTLAEIETEEKNKFSHRAIAFREMKKLFEGRLK
ncbi:MAG TPA: RdgB/HAM1 family non-canonical purine NTP pyrophosphatase [Ignavibacteriaceae bacterium]|nr:RdgB/HAM1 family non-canonical purine NTP pyrophosphatase [Ignavibacteriaceae bacterium]